MTRRTIPSTVLALAAPGTPHLLPNCSPALAVRLLRGLRLPAIRPSVPHRCARAEPGPPDAGGTGEERSVPGTAGHAWLPASPPPEAAAPTMRGGPAAEPASAVPTAGTKRFGLPGRAEALLVRILAAAGRSLLHSLAEHALCHGGAPPAVAIRKEPLS